MDLTVVYAMYQERDRYAAAERQSEDHIFDVDVHWNDVDRNFALRKYADVKQHAGLLLRKVTGKLKAPGSGANTHRS